MAEGIFSTELESRGFVRIADAVSTEALARLGRLLEPETLPGAARHASGLVYAARHLLIKLPQLGRVLNDCGIDLLAAKLVGPGAYPIDAGYFDKQPGANWTVPVHQDRLFPVFLDSERRHRVVDGVVVAEPSLATLTKLLALRIHFDANDAETGALFVLPGSHASGIASAGAPTEPLARFVPCVVDAGDVLAMRPLLQHRSPPSKSPRQRRVLHVVYAVAPPDSGIRWRRPANAP